MRGLFPLSIVLVLYKEAFLATIQELLEGFEMLMARLLEQLPSSILPNKGSEFVDSTVSM